jgi:predicted nuclease with RNAse H fold
MADTVVVTAPDSASAVLQPTLTDAIAAAQLDLTLVNAAKVTVLASQASVNASTTTALAAAAAAQASAASAAAIVSGGGISTTVALLPAGTEGLRGFATNGRKISELTGSGSGVPVYYSAGLWRCVSTDAPVLA